MRKRVIRTNDIKKGIAALLAASMVFSHVEIPAFAGSSEETEAAESGASVKGGTISRKSVTLDLLSDDLREAALTAIRENELFDAQDYLGATSDSKKAIKEYEAFFNENPGLYVVEVPGSVSETLENEAEAELRIFVQKDEKMRKAMDIASASELTRDEAVASRDVEFRYGTEKDIILYEPATDVDTLINGGEDAYYKEPEQDSADNSYYELTGKEKITFMFVNNSDKSVNFTLNVDDITYDKLTVSGKDAALKKVLSEAGKKKADEEETKKIAETTKAVEAEKNSETTKDAETEKAAEKTKAVEATKGETVACDAEEENGKEETETSAEKAESASEAAVETLEETTEAVETAAESTEAETEESITESRETSETETAEAETEETLEVSEDTESGIKVEVTEASLETSAEAEETEDETEVEKTIPEKIADAFRGFTDGVTGLFSGDKEEAEETEAAESAEETTSAVTKTAETETPETEAVETTGAEKKETAEVNKTDDKKSSDGKKSSSKKSSSKKASASEIDETEYDEFAEEKIAEAKEAVKEDKDAAKENIKVAKIAQYTLDELGKIHYETEIDGFKVDVFASRDAFEISDPKLSVKKLCKPEEKDGSKDVLSDEEIAELKKNDIYDHSQSLDVSFTDFWDKKVEPQKPVKVRITISDEQLLGKIDASSLEIHHLKEIESTLKTEKVAATEDVKLLDENDEKISDSDLETNTEEDAENDEKAVNVASAVAEFEVESFSVFAITWNAEGTPVADIRVHYVDSDGNPIKINGQEVNSRGLNLGVYHQARDYYIDGNGYYYYNAYDVYSDIKLSDVEGGITGYTYKGARLNSPKGQEITDVKSVENSFIVEYYNNGNLVESNNYYNWKQTDKGAYTSGNHDKLYYYDGDESTLPKDDDGYYVKEDNSAFKLIKNDSLEGKTLYRQGKTTTKWGWKGIIPWLYSYYHYIPYDGERYDQLILDEIYLVYEKTPYSDSTLPDFGDLNAIDSDKNLQDNGDGTYTLTLSVTGQAKSVTADVNADVLILFDLSSSMDEKSGSKGYAFAANGAYKYVDGQYIKIGSKEKYTGERYDEKSDIKRLDAAKVSVCHLIDELFANNTDGKKKVEIGLITFGGTVDAPSGKYSDADTLKNVIKNLNSKSGKTVEGGTNWEAALIEANKYNFDDSDPEYVVFVSDGNPTYRVNANGYYDDPKVGEGYRGGGTYDPNGMCLKAAEAAADDLVNHNKQLYAINIFGDAGNMQNLVNNNGSFYRTAADQAAINSAFKDVVKVINGNLSYAEVDITDGITSLTHSALSTQVSGTTSGFTYSVVDKNGKALDEELEAIKAYPATFVKSGDGTSSVDWHIGGEGKNHKLLEGATYSLSFLVWPDQKVYDDYAEGKGASKYATNTYAKVYYSKLIEETGKTPKLEEQTPIDLKSGEIDLTTADVQVEKIWKMNEIKTQEAYIDKEPVVLTLFKDGSSYKTIEIASSENDVKDTTNNTVTWKGGTITLAPGTLVSVYDAKGKEKHPELKGNKTIKDKANKEYYLLGEGHKYSFTEKSHSDKFELLEKIYHPMLVDGELTNVTFTFSEDGKTIEAIEAMESMVEDNAGKLKAYNELKFETLTVSNTYTGNMAVAQETTFDLYLFRNKVDEITKKSEPEAYTDDDIVSLNFDENKKSGIKLDPQKDGAYRFTIKPDFVDQPKSVSINLPAGVSYQIVEVKDGKPYAEYETKWKQESESILTKLAGYKTSCVTDVLELSSVNTINFVNTLNALIPTGFADNMLPFIAIAIAGISALGFLAFDFRRRRMFED